MNYSFQKIDYKPLVEIVPNLEAPNSIISLTGNIDISIKYVKDCLGALKIKRESENQVVTVNGIKLDSTYNKRDILLSYIDVDGVIEIYRNDSISTSIAVTIPPVVVIPPVIVPPIVIPPTEGNGILWEMWKGTSTLGTPFKKQVLTSFSAPTGQGDSYVGRIRGYIIAPSTGVYTFYIACDDFGSLKLSTDNTIEKAVQIASVPDWVGVGNYTRYPSQTSKQISLIAGSKYYIEANMTQGGGGDHLSVAWKIPNSNIITIIPGNNLIQY